MNLTSRHFDFTGPELRVDGLGRPPVSVAAHRDHELRLQAFRVREHTLVVAGYHLSDPRTVAHVEKDERAHVANPVDPSEQHDLRADVLWPKLAAGMCPSEVAELGYHTLILVVGTRPTRLLTAQLLNHLVPSNWAADRRLSCP